MMIRFLFHQHRLRPYRMGLRPVRQYDQYTVGEDPRVDVAYLQGVVLQAVGPY
jgi:hypothetical protein